MITVYSSDTCAPCVSLKRFLDHKIEQGHTEYIYRVFDADQEPHTSQLWRLTGRRVVPTTLIEGHAPIVGLNYAAITKALKM